MSASTLTPEQKEDLRLYVARRVAEGFDSEEDILEDTLECFADDYGEGTELTEFVNKLVSQQMAEHLQEERNWKGETDCDKLDKAFTELEENGIIARQNFTCCQTCGHAEIWEEVEQVRQEFEQSRKQIQVMGYLFYHMQDMERVVEESQLYLAYGSTDNADDSTIRVAQKASEIFRKHGLHVNWNGSLDKRICLEEFNWRRRRLVFAV